MVYAGEVGTQKFSLGVSGRLKDSNLIMWDEETNSLWSQIKGEALYGESKGKQLPMLPAVFVSLATWSSMHPETLVLDMSPVRQRAWYYTSEDLARGAVKRRTRRGKSFDMPLGLGLRQGGETLACPITEIKKAGALNLRVGKTPVVLVWVESSSAALAYDRRVSAPPDSGRRR